MNSQPQPHSHPPSSAIRAADLPTPELRNKAKELKANIRAALKKLPVKLTPTGIEFDENSLKGVKVEDLRKARKLIEELREMLNPTITLKTLEIFLKETITKGKPLETLLEAGSLEAEIEQGLNAFKDGELSFTPNLSRLSFPTDPNTLEQLKAGLESGALTGTILTAFPSEADLTRLVMAINDQEAKRVAETKATNKSYTPKIFTADSLKDMTVSEFLARHFEARGGIFFERDSRIEFWNKLRWEPNETEIKAGRTTLAAVYATASDHEAAFNRLKLQTTLGEALGMATLSFTFTRKENLNDIKILQRVNPNPKEYSKKQSNDLTFKRLMDANANILTPLEWLSLLNKSANPQDYNTYPTPYGIDGVYNCECLGGITSSDSASAYSSLFGVSLSWLNPLGSSGNLARSVLRGTPWF